jgi:hypothetical protein
MARRPKVANALIVGDFHAKVLALNRDAFGTRRKLEPHDIIPSAED